MTAISLSFLIGAVIAFAGMTIVAVGTLPSRQPGRWLEYGFALILVGALVMIIAGFR